METIRLYVGTSANNEDLEAEMVLEFTARKYCSLPLEIIWMRQSAAGPWSGWASSRNNRTPFSSFRWSPPSVCGYKGKAIYTDVDFFFVADLAELWNQPIPKGKVALVRNPTGKLSTSCILFDCARAKGHVPPLEELRAMPDAHGTVLNYFRAHPELLAATVGNWDCPDLSGSSLDDPKLRAVHFTRIESQLHLKYAVPRLAQEGGRHWYTGPVFTHPRSDLVTEYDRLYAEAIAAGYTLDKYRVTPFDKAARKAFTYKHHVGGAQ